MEVGSDTPWEIFPTDYLTIFVFLSDFWVNLNMIISNSELTIYKVDINGKNTRSLTGENKFLNR